MTLKLIFNDDLKMMSEMNSWGQTCIKKSGIAHDFMTFGKKVTF